MFLVRRLFFATPTSHVHVRALLVACEHAFAIRTIFTMQYTAHHQAAELCSPNYHDQTSIHPSYTVQ